MARYVGLGVMTPDGARELRAPGYRRIEVNPRRPWLSIGPAEEDWPPITHAMVFVDAASTHPEWIGEFVPLPTRIHQGESLGLSLDRSDVRAFLGLGPRRGTIGSSVEEDGACH